MRGKERGTQQVNGVRWSSSRSRFRRELVAHRFPLFAWFSSSGNAYKWSALKVIMLHTVEDGKHHNRLCLQDEQIIRP